MKNILISELDLKLNIELIELSIKVLKATKGDPKEIKEAINLHSVLLVELMPKPNTL